MKGVYKGVFFDIDRQSYSLGNKIRKYIIDTIIVTVIIIINYIEYPRFNIFQKYYFDPPRKYYPQSKIVLPYSY
jgi:hypothetical protein